MLDYFGVVFQRNEQNVCYVLFHYVPGNVAIVKRVLDTEHVYNDRTPQMFETLICLVGMSVRSFV